MNVCQYVKREGSHASGVSGGLKTFVMKVEGGRGLLRDPKCIVL